MDGQMMLEPLGLLDKLLNQVPFWVSGVLWMVVILGMLWAIFGGKEPLIDRITFTRVNFSTELLKGNLAVGMVVSAMVIGFIVGMCMLAGRAVGAELDRYDDHFQRAMRLQFGTTLDWNYLKAQAMTESAMNPMARSPVGAAGLMQFMPATARDFRIDPYNPRDAIYAGADYMRRLYGIFSAPRPILDRYAFAAASYNRGAGNVLHIAQPKARAAVGSDALWRDIQPFLPAETAAYWPRIERWHERFGKGG